MKELVKSNLGLGKVTYEKSNEKKGTVIWQSITAYSEVPEKIDYDRFYGKLRTIK